MAINRCQNCKIGTSFCVYTKTVEVETKFGKKYHDVPANNCIIGNEDEYALWPDTEEVDRGIGDIPFMEMRVCEDDSDIMDPFISNKYLWEGLTTNVTTGDTFDIEGRRFDDIHPLFHMIDYNVPMNKTGIIKPNENCHIVGQGSNISLVSKNWEIDDFGEAKKVIGIPKIRYCVGLYGTRDNNTGIIMHKSMKDWTRHIPTFKNFTKLKVNRYQNATMNIFTSNVLDIDTFVSSIIKNDKIKKRLYEAYKLIKKGKYINIYSLLLNNDVQQSDVFKITNTISTKNPKLIYKNKEGYRYNISKIKSLYFNIINDIINIKFNKEEILANIVNYVLNDIDLLNHRITKPKMIQYNEWYESIKNTIDKEFLDDIRPERVMFNHYSSDDKFIDAITIISDAIYKQNIIDVTNLPQEFKDLFKYNKEYNANYIEEQDILDMNAPSINIKQLINITYVEAYNNFTKLLHHIDIITPNELKHLWEIYQDAWIIDTPEIFWDYVQELSEEYNNIGYKLNELYISDNTLDIINIDTSHSNYIRAKNKRYYDIENQDREHFKILLEDSDEFDEIDDDVEESIWG